MDYFVLHIKLAEGYQMTIKEIAFCEHAVALYCHVLRNDYVVCDNTGQP